MFSMRMSGTMKFVDGEEYVEDCPYTRRPYQLFTPVCREDLSSCVSGKSVGSLAISICAAKPVPVPGVSFSWADNMRFEGFCKNAFWLISDLYARSDLAEQRIPIFITTNESGVSRLAMYADACGYPHDQIIVHPDEAPPTERDRALPNAIKFAGLAHDELSRFMRVLHIDTSCRVPKDCYGIWKDTLAAWPPGKDVVNGKNEVFTRQRVPIPMIEAKLRRVSGVTDLRALRDMFFSRQTWPKLTAQCFGGSPVFWRNERLREILKRANHYLYGDGLCFTLAAIVLSVAPHQCLAIPNLMKHCVYHSEPLQLQDDELELVASEQLDFARLARFFDAVQVCLYLHGEDFDMEIEIGGEYV